MYCGASGSSPSAWRSLLMATRRLLSKSWTESSGHTRSRSCSRVTSSPDWSSKACSTFRGCCWSRTTSPFRRSSPDRTENSNSPNRKMRLSCEGKSTTGNTHLKTGGKAPSYGDSSTAARLLRSTKNGKARFCAGLLGVLKIATAYLSSALALIGKSFEDPPAIKV